MLSKLQDARVPCSLKKEQLAGTPLVVQWLRLHASNAGDTGSILGRGTKIPHAAWPTRKLEKKKKNWLCESRHSSPYLFFLDRFQEKGNLEVLLFTIQSRMRANNQKVYTPHDGKLVSDINRVQQRFPFHVASVLIELLIRAQGMVPGQG